MIWRSIVSGLLLAIVMTTIKCDATVHLYGVFQNVSSSRVYGDAQAELNATKADSGLSLSSNYSLNKFINAVENLVRNIKANNARKNVVFTDMYLTKNEILKEILIKVESKQATNLTQFIDVDDNLNGRHQVRLNLTFEQQSDGILAL